MKNVVISIVALVSTFPVLPAGASGRDALTVIQKQVADNSKDRVVQVVGVRGQDQPAEWRVVVQETEQGAGSFFMYTVQGDTIVKREAVQKDYRKQLPAATIPQGDILVDSNEVFRIADGEAKKAEIGFDSLNYELRCPELSSTPVWYVDLRDVRDRMVGRLFVSAKSGEVLRRIWFPPNDAVEQEQNQEQQNQKQQVAGEENPSPRHKGYLGEHSPQELPALSPVPEGDKEGSPVKSSLEAIRKGMAKIPNPLRGNRE